MKKLLILCPYPEKKAPSQRFRFEQYLPYLRENGFQVEVSPFWSEEQWPGIYKKGNTLTKILATAKAFKNRLALLSRMEQYDLIFVHREATPIGKPFIEWFASKYYKKPLIYDFDDAVWLPNASNANQRLVGRFKNHSKVGKILSFSQTALAGNNFLADYAAQFCRDVRFLPTTIDTENLHNRELYPEPQKSGITIGWTGTHSTLKQLLPLFPILREVHKVQPFNFLIIADEQPESMPSFAEFRKWNKDSEIPDLMRIDIGLMPLFDTDWERGKCGFKALQYLALEIPAVVSSVGVNKEIVISGHNGYLCEAMGEGDVFWKEYLLRLLSDEHLRANLGRTGRKTVIERYSIISQKDVLLQAIHEASRSAH